MADGNDEGSGYGPNPELYDKLSERHPTREQADEVVSKFLLAVKEVREKFGVPDVLVIACAYFEPEEEFKETTSVRARAFGHPEVRAQLGAVAFNTYTVPELDRADRLREIASGTSKSRPRR